MVNCPFHQNFLTKLALLYALRICNEAFFLSKKKKKKNSVILFFIYNFYFDNLIYKWIM